MVNEWIAKASLAAMTASSLFGNDPSSSAHLPFGGSSVLGRIVQAPAGWMWGVGMQPFSDLSRDALLGSGLDSGWAPPGFPLCFLGSMFHLVVLMKWKPSLQPEILWKRCIQLTFHPVLDCMGGINKVALSADFLHTWCWELWPQSFLFISSDRGILPLVVWQSFRCFLANTLLVRNGFRLPLYLINGCCTDGCPSLRFTCLDGLRIAFTFLVTCLTKALQPRLLSLAGWPDVGKLSN